MEEVQAGSKHSVSIKLRPVDNELLMTVHLTSAVSCDTLLYTVQERQSLKTVTRHQKIQ